MAPEKNREKVVHVRPLRNLWAAALSTALIASPLLGLLTLAAASPAAAADTSAPPPTQRQAWEKWRKSMARTPKPKKGCYKAVYPDTEWKEVQCTSAPHHPYLPARGPRPPETVGDGTDYTAVVSGSISSAEGSFVRVIGVTTESGGGYLDVFSLQLNTNLFSTSSCSGISGCQGWEQFIYSNSTGPSVFIQYWLLAYGATCPTGWISYEGSCYRNSTIATSVPAQLATALGDLTLTGNADSGGTDEVVLAVGDTLYSASGNNSVANLGTGWNSAEFNVFGDGNSTEAVFNSGSTILVRTSVDNGTTNAPRCENTGTTGETNNLTLVTSPQACCPIGGSSPAIIFTESNATAQNQLCSVPGLSPILNLLLH
jgi:hypothetical protein